MKIYLAGDIDTNWRDNFVSAIDMDDIKWIFPQEFEQLVDPDQINIVDNDLALIDESDMVVAYFHEAHRAFGTVCESFYAYLFKKPLIILINKNLEHLLNHPWLRTIATFRFVTDGSFTDVEDEVSTVIYRWKLLKYGINGHTNKPN